MQKVATQTQQYSTQEDMTDKNAAQENLNPRKVASLKKARALANLAGYLVHSSSFWKIGRVFIVLWTEPVGAGGTGITVPAMKWPTTAFHGVRRFMIVRSVEGHSMCM